MEVKFHPSGKELAVPEQSRHGGKNKNAATTKIGSKLNTCRL
jgi:hypothetical protein